MLKKFLFILLILFCYYNKSYAALSTDCVNYMMPNATKYTGDLIASGYNSSLVYTASDSMGIAQVCRNQFPSFGERFIFTRTTDDWTTAQYKVSRDYCWVRNVFDNGSCVWPIGEAWGDNYSYTFSDSDIKNASDSSGRQILTTGTGGPGYNVCLKRYKPGETLNQGGTNTTKKPIICAYIVNALGANSCNSPLINWSSATIGCVQDVIKSRPPTFNTTMPGTIAPYVDMLSLLDTVDEKGNKVPGYLSHGSTFDQPVIRLIKASGSDSMLLRYKFPGDTYAKPGDTLKQCDVFPNTSDNLQYCAMVPDNQPDKVCACEKNSGCPNKLWMGCVPRPTPSQSGLAIVAEYNPYIDTTNQKVIPALNVAFALTDTAGEIIWYDNDGAKVYFDASKNPFKLDSSGNPTNDPATLPLKFNRLPLPNPALSIREQYIKPINTGTSTAYFNQKETGKVYGVDFETIIPKLDNVGKPQYIGLQTEYSRATTDGCNAIDYGLAGQANLQQFYVPDGSRNRTNCACPPQLGDPRVCPIPQLKPCADGTTQPHNQNALKIYCPGLIAGYPGGGGINICLRTATPWSGGGLTTDKDKLCIPIPIDCNATFEPYKETGYAIWPKIDPGKQVASTCDSGYGLEQRKHQYITPDQPVDISNFNEIRNYEGLLWIEDIYVRYLDEFSTVLNTFSKISSDSTIAETNIRQEQIDYVTDLMRNKYKIIGAQQHAIEQISLAPQKACPLPNTPAKPSVTHGCVFMNDCPAITKAGFITGYATWPKVRALNTSEQAQLASNPDITFNIQVTGTCNAPNTQVNSSTPPTRVCSLQYKNGKPYIFKWQDVQNPCLAPLN